MHLAQRSFYNASIQYLSSLLLKVIGLLLLVRSTAIGLKVIGLLLLPASSVCSYTVIGSR